MIRPADDRRLPSARDRTDPRKALRKYLAFLAQTPSQTKKLDALVRHCRRVVVSDGGIEAYLAGNPLDGVLTLAPPADWSEAPWKSLRRHLPASVVGLMDCHERIVVDMSSGLATPRPSLRANGSARAPGARTS